MVPRRSLRRAKGPQGLFLRGPALVVAALSAAIGSAAFLQSFSTGAGAGGRRHLALGLATSSLLSLGRPEPVRAEVAWGGAYDDPEYPGCKRRILDLGSGKIQVNIKEPDRGRTCKQNKNLEKFLLPGTVQGDQITVDFSPKGGPSKVVGKFDGNAIVFQDGKTWTKIAGDKKKTQKGVMNTRMGGIQFTDPED